mgnify:CR=1 FL=1
MTVAQGRQDPARWERMKDGTDCPMCQDGHLPVNPFSFLVVELVHSYVRLPRNQFMRGWTLLILKRHACELYELTSTKLVGFFAEVARVAQAVAGIYQPAKLNYGVFGNLCPHIHCHIVVQQRRRSNEAVAYERARSVAGRCRVCADGQRTCPCDWCRRLTQLHCRERK